MSGTKLPPPAEARTLHPASRELAAERRPGLLVEVVEGPVLDDGRSDRTWQVATAYARSRPWLQPYRNQRNRGSGYNTKRAISLA